MNFGKRLRKLRESKNISQVELAKVFNITSAALSQYELNKRFPDEETLHKLADYFDVSVDYLLGRTDIRAPHISDEYAKKHKVTKRDLSQYEDFIQHAGAFFMNDEVADDDKEKLFRDISELFWKAKEINKEKYGKKKKTKNE